MTIITKTCTIDCPSITNINRLIDIDCHRLSSIIDCIDWLGPDYYQLSRGWSNGSNKLVIADDRLP